MLTLSAFLVLSAIVFAKAFWTLRRNWKLLIIFSVLLCGGLVGAAAYFGKMYDKEVPVGVNPEFFNAKFRRLSEGKIPLNLEERLKDWRLFGAGIVESPRTMLVGHSQPIPRGVRSSPHNGYIDIAYTFGLLALVPVAALIGYTAGGNSRPRFGTKRSEEAL